MIFNLQNVNIFRDPPSTQRWEKLVKVHENRRRSNRADPCFSKRALKTVVYSAALLHYFIQQWGCGLAWQPMKSALLLIVWLYESLSSLKHKDSVQVTNSKKDEIFMCCITFLVFGGILSRRHWEPHKSTQVCGNTLKLKSSKAKLTFLIIQWRKL